MRTVVADDAQADAEPGEAADAAEDVDPDPDDLVGAVSFGNLSPTDFEEFCFDLLIAAGFTNVDWRKGTPKSGSPSDQGRDIVAEYTRTDIDGHTYTETWFIDCKHYGNAVPPDALANAAAWASAERPGGSALHRFRLSQQRREELD